MSKTFGFDDKRRRGRPRKKKKEQTITERQIPQLKMTVEELFTKADVREKAMRAFIDTLYGYTPQQIADRYGWNYRTVWGWLHKIEQSGARLTNRKIEAMKNKFADRMETLTREAYAVLEQSKEDPELKLKAIEVLRKVLKTEGEAFWITKKEEPIGQESPLSMTRAWIHEAEKMLGDEENESV